MSFLRQVYWARPPPHRDFLLYRIGWVLLDRVWKGKGKKNCHRVVVWLCVCATALFALKPIQPWVRSHQWGLFVLPDSFLFSFSCVVVVPFPRTRPQRGYIYAGFYDGVTQIIPFNGFPECHPSYIAIVSITLFFFHFHDWLSHILCWLKFCH